MATAISTRSDEIDLKTPNVPQVFALKSPDRPREVGQWGRMMWTAVDGRKIFLGTEDASEFHHELVTLGIQPADFIRVTRVKHPGRGGGFSIRVERVPDTTEPARMPASREESLLEKSVAIARQNGPAAFITKPEPAAERTPVKEQLPNLPNDGNDYQHLFNSTAVAPKYKAAYAIAIEILIEAKRVALSQGLAFDVRCEDVRCLAATIIIDGQQGGRR